MHWNTVSPLLKSVLIDLMNEDLFGPFRLVGGTALSLQLGHRLSVDIDLFTNAEYGSIDFYEIKDFLEYRYDYCSYRNLDIVAMGTYFEIGESKDNFVKIDLFYTDQFIFEALNVEQIRMASPEDIIAMKLEVINNNGRKKDFWDLHYFLDIYSFDEMIAFYKQRYPYNESATLKQQLINFDLADKDFDPVCLLSKDWELIKYDFIEKLS